ncbi:carbamoyl-phosphate-synthetase [Thiohalorhabdus denitrificans]|uniref:ATP-grasp domain-containing protein n=1 Tax=Thiohalorhabdus denitrificans TaxID=381306 RepID=A0A0P9C5T4_9GAMM|nr:ATP-grasp domain-containing protein [Thiohalorhabdus denitrificans]KPV40418.1 carbamoyl-phosphate-synthetase [Thiohalorhabdus denitrificans]SCY60284.1 ATP-grasp domain-containing protein [Thiohalorhabdus denitrificans]
MGRLIFLGASPMQTPPIRYARQAGHHVITVDNRPDNPGHRLAHECHNVSTTDSDGVLALARQLDIDGIVAYASDPAAPTAAYVGNRLGLPSNPYETVQTLADKQRFRSFLEENGFNTPWSETFTEAGAAQEFAELLARPCFVKPADSSGSKGVSRVRGPGELPGAYARAEAFSRSGRVVVEEAIEKEGYQIDADAFVVDGELRFCCWSNQHTDPKCNGIVPAGISFPSTLSAEQRETAERHTQRLLDETGFRNGALNIELVFTEQGDLYFLEVGPRNGGNLIPEVNRYATGVDLIKYTVEAALGGDCRAIQPTPVSGFWASYIVHAQADGILERLWISDEVRERIVEQNIWASPGDPVRKFSGSQDTLGTMILRFRDMEEMLEMMDNMEHYLFAEVSPAKSA